MYLVYSDYNNNVYKHTIPKCVILITINIYSVVHTKHPIDLLQIKSKKKIMKAKKILPRKRADKAIIDEVSAYTPYTLL